MAINIVKARIAEYPIVQNMARFYVYDLSRFCGKSSQNWAMPEDGLYESTDFKNYFENIGHHAYLVRVDGELAGFALINQATVLGSSWNMGEFFISARFQGKGIGQVVAHFVWQQHPGTWEVAVIPENVPAVHFWRNAVNCLTNGQFHEEVHDISYDADQPLRIIFQFNSV